MKKKVSKPVKARAPKVAKKFNEDAVDENADDQKVISMFKRLQQQITFLERKVDNLTSMLEDKSHKGPGGGRFAQGGGRSYPSNFSSGRTSGYRGAGDNRSAGYHKGGNSRSDSSESFYGKPFSKASGGRKGPMKPRRR